MPTIGHFHAPPPGVVAAQRKHRHRQLEGLGDGFVVCDVAGKVTVNGRWPIDQIDHIDNNRSNNRISNLREANNHQQNCNTRLTKRNSSGYKGVSWDKNLKKWRSEIRVNYKKIHLGYYKTPEEAHEAYRLKSDELFGEFANHG